MRFLWRGRPITGHAGWRSKIAKKDDRPNRSAPTIAAAWSGPMDLYAALEQVSVLRDLVIESIDVAVQTAFDSYEGGVRNHDLVIEGEANGGSVVICIEAKAGEDLGPTLRGQARTGERTLAAGKRTLIPNRLQDLLNDWAPDLDPNDEAASRLRYQLFTAAGTLAEARTRGAEHAVLMIHEFLTDEREGSADADLRAFAAAVFPSEELPEGSPWCVAMPLPDRLKDDATTFYLARAVTVLRPLPAQVAD